MARRRPLSRAATLAIAVVAALVIGLGVRFAMQRWLAPAPPATADGAGAVAIGGPFTLVDQDGRTRSDGDFRGRFMLVYFGYSYCPDVCPTELTTMSAAIDALGDKGDKVTPVFITIDPERDTVARLKSYAANFHRRLVALTGTPAQIRAAARAYRVYYAKRPTKDGETYFMDHTSIVYLMGPDGRFLQHFTYGTTADDMAAGIARHL